MHAAAASIRTTERLGRVEYEEYHPYGSTAWWAGNSATVSQKRYRYTGMERNEETGLQCHGVRYYAPWLGRWVSADPIGLSDGVNVFAYCHARPTSHMDLSGMDDVGMETTPWPLVHEEELAAQRAADAPLEVPSTGEDGVLVTAAKYYVKNDLRRNNISDEPLFIRGLAYAGVAASSWYGEMDQLHQLPERLLTHYMYAEGAPFTLDHGDVVSLDPQFNFPGWTGISYVNDRLTRMVTALTEQGGGTAEPFRFSMRGTDNPDRSNNTLGNLRADFEGTLSVDAEGAYSFAGTMQVRDVLNFDPRPGQPGRSDAGEFKTFLLWALVPGHSFKVSSVPVDVVYDSHEDLPKLRYE